MMHSVCRKPALAFAFGRHSKRPLLVPPSTAFSTITLRGGGSSETAFAEAAPAKTSAKELYQELLTKLETITHLGECGDR